MKLKIKPIQKQVVGNICGILTRKLYKTEWQKQIKGRGQGGETHWQTRRDELADAREMIKEIAALVFIYFKHIY